MIIGQYMSMKHIVGAYCTASHEDPYKMLYLLFYTYT